MKKYSKAQIIAKNLPTGSYAAGCPAHTRFGDNLVQLPDFSRGGSNIGPCSACEVTR